MRRGSKSSVSPLRSVITLLGVVPGLLSLVAPVYAAGTTTPGVTVTATNPASARSGSDLFVSLTAHSESTTVPDPSCRPEDQTVRCWGSLMLRIPEYGDLAVGNFEVHRVAVGDISCGDEGGCGDGMLAAATTGEPVQAQVNGVGVVKWAGNSGLTVGDTLQLKLTLTDYGTAQYQDQLVVQVSRFIEGSDKPQLYLSRSETIRQVRIVSTPGTG